MAGKAKADVTIEGTPLGTIAALDLVQEADGHHHFTLECPLEEHPDALRELGLHYVGKRVTIHLTPALREDGGELIFEGVIDRLRLRKTESAAMRLVLSGTSPTALLDDGPAHRSFEGKTVAEVVKLVLNDYPHLPAEIDVQHDEPIPYLTQYDESAFAFLKRVLATYGEWAYYDGRTAVFGRPASEEPVELVFGRDATGIEIDASIAPVKFELSGYDYLGDEHLVRASARADQPGLDDFTRELIGKSEEVYPHEPTTTEGLPAPDQATVDRQVRRRRAGIVGSLLTLSGSSIRLGLAIGGLITVRALARTLSAGAGAGDGDADYGQFRVTSLRHTLDRQGNYANEFKAIPAAVETPPITEQQITPPQAEQQFAVVTENDDPEQLARVRVQLPWQKRDNAQTPWLRIVGAAAGLGHGAYFVPEIGDQVGVAFAFGHPDRPFVTGSLYHGGVKPADAHDPDNDRKIIRTRSGNQIAFSDKGGEESITIENGTNVVTLTLKGDSGIDIKTAGDLTLSGKNVTIAAEENLVISAGNDASYDVGKGSTFSAGNGCTIDGGPSVDLTATDVNAEAKASIVVQGGTTADVKAPNATVSAEAVVTVEGPMVNLN